MSNQSTEINHKQGTDNPSSITRFTSTYLRNGWKNTKHSEIHNSKGKISITEEETSEYAYDWLGRLTKETHTGSGEASYEYDAHNNRSKMTTDSQVKAYTCNKNDELLRIVELNRTSYEDAVTLYKNDPNGNQLATVKRRKTNNGGKPTFDLNVTLGDNRLNDNVVNHYDALNQLTATLTKDKKVTYEYNLEGLRTKKNVNGKETNSYGTETNLR